MRRRFEDVERSLGLESASKEDPSAANFDEAGTRGTGALVRAGFILAGSGLNISPSELESKSSLRFLRVAGRVAELPAPVGCCWTRRFTVVFAIEVV